MFKNNQMFVCMIGIRGKHDVTNTKLESALEDY